MSSSAANTTYLLIYIMMYWQVFEGATQVKPVRQGFEVLHDMF